MNLFAHKITISKEKAIYDIWYLKKTLEDIHPDLYYSISEDDFDFYLNDIIRKSNKEVDINSLTMLLIPTVNMLNDGHTYVSWPDKCIKSEKIKYFPLKIDMQTYEISRVNEYNIPIGAKLNRINTISIHKIADQIIPYINGEKDYYKRSKLEYELPYYLWKILSLKDSFEIEYCYKGTNYKKTILGSNKSSFYQNYENVEGEFKVTEYKGSEYGMLKLSLFGDSKGYFDLIDRCFSELKDNEVKELIIDLRDNPGGNTLLANRIFQYISKEPFKLYESITTKFSKPTKRFYRKYCIQKPYLIPFLVGAPQFWKAKGFKMKNDLESRLYIEEEKKFEGKVILVTSNYCYSTADDFSRAFKKYKMGTIIGEETGGQKDSFGDIVFFKLPNSKILCACSHKIYHGLDLNDSSLDGVKPDISVNCKNYSDEELLKMIAELNETNNANN